MLLLRGKSMSTNVEIALSKKKSALFVFPVGVAFDFPVKEETLE